VEMNAQLHPQAVGNIAWASCTIILLLVHRRSLPRFQALNKMCAITGGDNSVVAALCSTAVPRLASFDTQSLAQLFCASVKHTTMTNYSQFISSACQQLSLRIASMDGVSAGCLAGALTTAAQNLSEADSCYGDVRHCMAALCSRWLLPPSLTLGPQHTAFLCRCLLASLPAVQAVVGDRLSIRDIRHRVTDAVAGIISEMNWFSIAHVELLLILLSHHQAPGVSAGSWLTVPKKHKNILKTACNRMSEITLSMHTAFGTFDNEACAALIRSPEVGLLLVGAASVLVCGGGGAGEAAAFQRLRCISHPFARVTEFIFAGDDTVKEWLLKTNANMQIIPWSRSVGGQSTASPWLSLETKCSCAVLRHPGCSSSCTMLVHMAISGSFPRAIS
jgi:hypothetical protein